MEYHPGQDLPPDFNLEEAKTRKANLEQRLAIAMAKKDKVDGKIEDCCRAIREYREMIREYEHQVSELDSSQMGTVVELRDKTESEKAELIGIRNDIYGEICEIKGKIVQIDCDIKFFEYRQDPTSL